VGAILQSGGMKVKNTESKESPTNFYQILLLPVLSGSSEITNICLSDHQHLPKQTTNAFFRTIFCNTTLSNGRCDFYDRFTALNPKAFGSEDGDNERWNLGCGHPVF